MSTTLLSRVQHGPPGTSQANRPRAAAVISAGIASILTFEPVSLAVPPTVQVRKVDLATEVQILAFHQRQRQRQRRDRDPLLPGLRAVVP
ncbi:MAG: hypothetical protein ABR500_00715 [Dermatophilaceae bacterium]